MKPTDENQAIMHVRVLQVEPNPLPPLLRTHPDQIILTYRVDWVDWTFAWSPGSPLPTSSRLQRLLDAVKHDQVVSPA